MDEKTGQLVCRRMTERWTYLLVKDGLGLTTETLLLAIVSSLTLSENGILALLVLGHFVHGVLFAVSALAKSLSGFRNVDLFDGRQERERQSESGASIERDGD